MVIHHGTEYVTQKKSFEQCRRMGRSLRDNAPLESHGEWEATAERPDPVSRLHEDDNARVSVLVPVRYERMLQSPFAFLRGAAAIMADDLATTPNIGVRVQTCGDAHLGNFGILLRRPNGTFTSTLPILTRRFLLLGSGTSNA